MPSISRVFRWYDLLLLVVAAGVVSLYVATAGGGFPLDDSWIHQVYGRNLAEYGEWAFIPGEPSGASTSPLYTILLALGYALNVPYALWTHGIGILALTVTGITGARMAEHLRPHTSYIAVITGLFLVLTWHLVWAAASGMETMVFSMFSLLLIDAVWSSVNYRLSPRAGLRFGLLAALMTATRPEGILLAGLCGVAVLVTAYRDRPWRWIIGTAIGFFIVITPYLLLNLSLTGGILPATADAKYLQHRPLLALPYIDRVWRMTVPIIAGAQFLILPGVVIYLLVQGRKSAVYWIPLLWCIGLIALYAARLPAAYQHGRYVIPALPALIIMGTVGIHDLYIRGKTSMPGRVLSRTLVIAAGAMLLYFGLLQGPIIYKQDVRIIEEEMVAPAHWIADHLPPQELLAVHDIGAVGYFAPRPILDIAGLVTTETVPYIGDSEGLWNLMREYNARYLMAFPDQIPGQDTNDTRLCPFYQSEGVTSPQIGGPKMVIYELTWTGDCPP